MKKFIALLLAALLTCALATTALAETTLAVTGHTCQWKLDNTGRYVFRSVSGSHHKEYIEQYTICTICGAIKNYSYADKPGATNKPHSTNGKYLYNFHNAGTTSHTFMQKCTICLAYCLPDTLPCSGAGGLHVTHP